MSEKTIALSGAEVKVTFSGGNAWLRNDGAAVVYASKTAGVTAGANGVVSIPTGCSAPVYGANGTVFLLGAGSVQLIGSDYATNPFKTSAQAGGSGADEVARAAIETHAGNAEIHVTAEEKALWNGKADRQSYAPIFSGDILDIPEMGTYSCHISNCSNLPSGIYDWGYVTMYNFNNSGYKRFICTPLDALGHSYSGKPNGMIYLASETYKDTDGNLIWSRACDGGDATTLESLPAKDFLQNLGTWSTGNIDDLILGANKSGIVWINTTVTGMPVEGKFWFGIIDCSNAHRCLRVTSQTDGQSFVRAYNSSTKYWYAWHNVSDGGNADTLDGKHASDFVLKSDYDALAARVAALEGN